MQKVQAAFYFHGELKDFLTSKRQQRFEHTFSADTSIKHLIESLGVPHTEVEALIVNGRSVDFTYLPQTGDAIDVYPVFESVGVEPLVPLRPLLPAPPRFILDIHLGRLCMYLRLLGFDTLYPTDNFDDEHLAQLAHDQNRIMLTRDRGLLKRSIVTFGYCLRTRDPQAQVEAVIHRFNLMPLIEPWQRCLKCNGRLRLTPKADLLDRLEPKTKQFYDEFHLCLDCDQIYWKGSHFAKLENFLQEIVASGGQTP